MASASNPSTAPILLRSRKYQWYWNCAVDPWSADDERWQRYTDVENEILEDAHNQKMCETEIDGDYIINLEGLLQYKRGDAFSASPIKRVELEKDRNNIYSREERFLLPIPLSTSTCASPDENELNLLQIHSCITGVYWELVLKDQKQTITDVVEEAARGIIKEGSAIGKVYEARWLSQQLLAIKDFGCSVQVNSIERFPPVIGKTCVYLYTSKSFW